MDGVINVYKEQGFTSHDVVAKLRGILHTKKIGHTGTLDPDAVGVLPVCIGKATKLCDLITDWNKTYEAVMLLGVTTDTQDISGRELSRNDVNVDERQVVEMVSSFVGEYDQIPPMYSALKYNGKKLYELARAGIEVERKSRRVLIKSIHINDMNLSDSRKTVTFTVECSKGTYIRTLCEDIGKKLGCGACMMKLTRTRVGNFGINDSLTLNQIAALVLKGGLNDKIVNIDSLFHYESVIINEEYSRLLYNGNKLLYERCVSDEGREAYKNNMQYDGGGQYEGGVGQGHNNVAEGERFRVYDCNNTFIGIYGFVEGFLQPIKMFYTGGAGTE